jgi:hypothetical protein
MQRRNSASMPTAIAKDSPPQTMPVSSSAFHTGSYFGCNG